MLMLKGSKSVVGTQLISAATHKQMVGLRGVTEGKYIRGVTEEKGGGRQRQKQNH